MRRRQKRYYKSFIKHKRTNCNQNRAFTRSNICLTSYYALFHAISSMNKINQIDIKALIELKKEFLAP